MKAEGAFLRFESVHSVHPTREEPCCCGKLYATWALLTGCLFWTRSVTGAGLFYKMQMSFGHLTAPAGGFMGHVFPVAIGETGSFYTAVRAPMHPL